MMTHSHNVLAETLPTVDVSSYTPMNLTAGIAHIRVGNSRRQQPAYHTDKGLSLSNPSNWGVLSFTIPAPMEASPVSEDRRRAHPEAFDGLSDGSASEVITEVITASNDPEKVIEALADPALKIVLLTLNEAGYYLNEHDTLVREAWPIVHDLTNPAQPITAIGYVTEALARRRQRGYGPVTILACDDLPHNGNRTRQTFLAFAEARDAELARWIAAYVTFPNSLIGRIYPGEVADNHPNPDTESNLSSTESTYPDNSTDWIIEDNFCAGRPEWELVGATFVSDIAPYEALKQQFLNASRSLLAYPAFLAGYRTVHDAMNDSVFSNYFSAFVHRVVTPLMTLPDPIDLNQYTDKLPDCRSAAVMNDQLDQLCFDGATKIPTFVLPILTKLIEQDKPTHCLAFLIAAYGHYLQAETDDKGVAYTVDEPFLTEDDWQKIGHTDTLTFLASSPLAGADLRAVPPFAAAYQLYRKQIAIYGVSFTLRQAMCVFWGVPD